MRRLALGALIILLAGCTSSSHPRAAPTETEFRELLRSGNGPNVAVTSDSADDPRLRTPLFPLPAAEVRAGILRAIARMPRWSVADSTGAVMWLTRRTRIFRFVDDLYLLVEPRGDGSAILVRSASRVGKGDLGQNRRNIAELWDAIAAERNLQDGLNPSHTTSPP